MTMEIMGRRINKTITIFLLAPIMLILGILFESPTTLILALLTMFGAAISASENERKPRGRAARIQTALRSGTDDFRALSGLVEALRFGSDGERAEAVRQLIIMLPRVQRSHSEYLPGRRQRELLTVALEMARIDEGLARATLVALRKVGGAEVLPLLQTSRTEDGRSWPMDEGYLQVLQATMEIVERRVRRMRMRITLLRASKSEKEETLMRPAARTLDDPRDSQLLRSSEPSLDAGNRSPAESTDEDLLRNQGVM